MKVLPNDTSRKRVTIKLPDNLKDKFMKKYSQTSQKNKISMDLSAFNTDRFKFFDQTLFTPKGLP